jgi:hypothetical protein
MSERPPLDLRSLADVDSPDVVRDALKTFRRHIVTRYVWMTLLVATLVAGAVWANTPTNLGEAVDRADVVASPRDAVWDVGDVRVSLLDVVSLGDTVGLHFVILPPGGAPGAGVSINVDGALRGMGFRNWESYVEVPRSSDGRFAVHVHLVCGGCPPQAGSNVFVVDLRALHVPESIWKELP